MSAGELGEATGVSSAAATTLLDRLERKGFVRRQRDAVDRRRVLVELTPQGRARLEARYRPLVEEGGRLLERFSDGELVMMREFLVQATDVVDRHRQRIRGSRTRGG